MEHLALEKIKLKRMIETDMTNEQFSFISTVFFREDLVLETLRGKLLGCNFKRHISTKVCQDIVKRFWDSPELKSRGDEVKALQLGAFHYKKPLNEYFDEAEKSTKTLDNIVGSDINPVDYVINRLKEYFNTVGINLRQATYKEKKAGKFTIRAASPSPGGIILPHEDMAQCLLDIQKGFEIQNVASYRVVGVNICLQNDNEGKLRCWNLKPTNMLREILGVKESGYPYPSEILTDVMSLDVPIGVGDIYFFDASNVHAVCSNLDAEGYRTTISFFMGFLDENTVAYWT
jgi:hypothetical protein